jgi:haloacetate dehalogenase
MSHLFCYRSRRLTLQGFIEQTIKTDGAAINLAIGGRGPPVLLLHGYPQTKRMWHKIAPRLAQKFTVVATDLRGYGASDKPEGGNHHSNYSKRAMALDQIQVMHRLGFPKFQVVGHDRGARVAHRMAVDHPNSVERLAVLDIAPTDTMYAMTDKQFATAYYHWFFLIQPNGLPERLISADPEFFLRRILESWSRVPDSFREDTIKEYLRYFCEPATIKATCEDYRAGATIDLEHSAEDTGRKFSQPLLALWGTLGTVGSLFDVMDTWREKATHVEGRGLSCGHFLAEEAPEETLSELIQFLK